MLIETPRTRLREMTIADEAFICELLNQPAFLRYIGDRHVRSVDDAATFIETRYRQSYRDHGFGLYAVVRNGDNAQVGICGFVKRDEFELPDLGFAFLPEYERNGYGFESAAAMMVYGGEKLKLPRVLAITSLDNDVSRSLLEKLGFAFERIITTPAGEDLNLFEKPL